MCSAKCCAIVLVAAALACHLASWTLSSSEAFTDSRLHLSGPTKCFSCERDMIQRHGPEWAWMGKQSKCFDCERQLASVHPDLANYTHGTKCFDCERELGGRLGP